MISFRIRFNKYITLFTLKLNHQVEVRMFTTIMLHQCSGRCDLRNHKKSTDEGRTTFDAADQPIRLVHIQRSHPRKTQLYQDESVPSDPIKFVEF